MRVLFLILLFSTKAFSQKVITQSTVIALPDSLLSKEERINPPNTIKKYLNGYKEFVSFNTDSIPEGSTNLWFTNSHAIGAVLTGYVSGAGTVSSSDNILQAIQKLNGNDGLKADLISPSFTTPSLGVATATSINKVAITAPATSATLTILDGKTATFNNSITIAGTDGVVGTTPTTSFTMARTDAAQSFIGLQSIASGVQLSPGGATGLLYAGAAATTTDLQLSVNTANTLSSGTSTRVLINQSLNQTLTAGSTGLLITRTETALGSGAHRFIAGQVSGSDRFSILNTGYANFAGLTSTLTSGEQLRLAYDGTAYTTFTVASSGLLSIATNPSNAINLTNGITAGGTTSNLYIGSNTGSTATTTSQYLFAGASTINVRLGIRGSTSATPAASSSYGSLVVGQNGATIAGSGTHSLYANAVIRPLTITGGAGTLTNSASLYVEGAATGATNNYSMWVDAGTSRIDGSTVIGGTTPDASALLDLQSTTQAFVVMRMTATQASAISSPIDGSIVYVTDTNGTFTSVGFWGRQGGAWAKL
jgi:hypothetical protein